MTGGTGARAGSQQAAVTRSHDRIAPVYDLLERPMDLMMGRSRRRLLARPRGSRSMTIRSMPSRRPA